MWTWTPDKKIGDEVAMSAGGRTTNRTQLVRIVAETDTQWILGNHQKTRVRKKDGRIVGGNYSRVYDDSPDMRKLVADGRERERIDSESFRVLTAIEDMYYRGQGGGREWIANHIGPLLPKEVE